MLLENIVELQDGREVEALLLFQTVAAIGWFLEPNCDPDLARHPRNRRRYARPASVASIRSSRPLICRSSSAAGSTGRTSLWRA